MRSYLIEDIYAVDAKKILASLHSLGYQASIEDIYYLPLPKEYLEAEQLEHLEQCGPYIMALESIPRLGEVHDFKLELLVRAQGRMRCSCVAYATPTQRAYMINFLDKLIKDLDISV